MNDSIKQSLIDTTNSARIIHGHKPLTSFDTKLNAILNCDVFSGDSREKEIKLLFLVEMTDVALEMAEDSSETISAIDLIETLTKQFGEK